MNVTESKTVLVEMEAEDHRIEEFSSSYSSSTFNVVFLEGNNTVRVKLTREFAKNLLSQLTEALGL